MVMNPLAHPLEALLDAQGHLLAADAPLKRLHLRAGGREGGMLAIPQLAALARMALSFGAPVSRPVETSDDDKRISLWVEAKPEENGVRLIVTSWLQQPLNKQVGSLAKRLSGANTMEPSAVSSGWSVQIDPRLVILAMVGAPDSYFATPPVGEPLLRHFVPKNDSENGLLARMSERQPIGEQIVRLPEAAIALKMSGRPLFDGDGSFGGYLCQLKRMDGSDFRGGHLARRAGLQTQTKLLPDSAFGREVAPALRQPVGRILANAETISNRLRGALRENYASYASDIADAARHLQSLIEDLADLEAIERADFDPAADDIDLADIARRVAGLLAVKASDHQMNIVPPAENAAMPARGEFRRVMQILVNLVTNAIRYSPDGSTITISVARAGEMAQVRVADQGSGIDADKREAVFQKFERLGRDGDGGSGLGLYISRRIAEALKGRLLVENSSAEGSVFLLEVPAD